MPLPAITVQQLNETGHRYRSELLRLPVIGIERSTRFMTLRPGVRYKETVFSPEFQAELQGYQSAKRQEVTGDFLPRTLETEFGACFFDFDPNQVIRSVYGHMAAQAGEGAVNTPSAREVAASVIKNVSKSLNVALFKAKKDETQSTTMTLFDGFDTITEKEITAGNISEEKGNLIVLKEKITEQNACQVLKNALFNASEELRDEDVFIYCPRSIADAYNENYLLTHPSVVYNDKYNQPYLEGSNNMATFAPVVGKKGSKYIHITLPSNMLVGVDQESDQERVEFHKYEPKLVTGELYMFFGTQFESIDPRRLLVIQLADDQWT